jgi:hypothetical protein
MWTGIQQYDGESVQPKTNRPFCDVLYQLGVSVCGCVRKDQTRDRGVESISLVFACRGIIFIAGDLRIRAYRHLGW